MQHHKTQQRVHRRRTQQEKEISLLYRLSFDAHHSVFIVVGIVEAADTLLDIALGSLGMDC